MQKPVVDCDRSHSYGDNNMNDGSKGTTRGTWPCFKLSMLTCAIAFDLHVSRRNFPHLGMEGQIQTPLYLAVGTFEDCIRGARNFAGFFEKIFRQALPEANLYPQMRKIFGTFLNLTFRTPRLQP